MPGKSVNKTSHHPWAPPKVRLARYLPLLIVFGLAVHLLLPQITSLENSISVVRSMSLWLVSLAVIAQVFSYLGSGYLLKVIVDLGKSRFSIFRGALITLAAASIGLVAGGWVGAAAATYRWVEKSEDTSEEAALAGVLPLLFNNALLIILTVIGLVFLLINHHLSSAQVIGYSIFLFVLGVSVLVVIYAIQHAEVVEPLVLRIVDSLMHLVRRAYDPSSVREAIENIYSSLALLRKSGWVRPALGSAMNICFDILTLYFLFIAAGYITDLGVLMAGYGLAFLLGKVAFLFPGGVGVIESGMTAIYTNLGVPGSVSVVVILSYRLFSFWIPSLLGFVVSGYLQRT
jgi:uncharacterized protein (TIRG00374 family)